MTYADCILAKTKRIRRALEPHKDADDHTRGKFLPTIGDEAVLEAEHFAKTATYEQLQEALNLQLSIRLANIAEEIESVKPHRTNIHRSSSAALAIMATCRQIAA